MRHRFTLIVAALLLPFAACTDRELTPPETVSAEEMAVGLSRTPVEPRGVTEGRQIFRFDDFGSWRFWTDTAQLHLLVQEVSPADALALGLKVDAEAIPPEVLQAVLAEPDLLQDPAVTRILLELDAVAGLSARVEGDQITRIGITCALCHSDVDNSVAAGIGRRLDGWPARDLAVGTILSLLPGLPTIANSLGVSAQLLRAHYASWEPGFYDARLNLDARLDAPPVLIPPAYGLHGIGLETYTGEGPISYWNNYVAVTQMRGRGSFIDPKLGIRILVPPQEDEVRQKLPFLRQYQLSLDAPSPPAGSFDPAAAARGRAVFEGPAGCTDCHTGPRLTDQGRLHDPAETGMEPTWAERGTTGKYRTTPLRALWQHPPYFHDGSAATLRDVIDHYQRVLNLNLSERQRQDLVHYLLSL